MAVSNNRPSFTLKKVFNMIIEINGIQVQLKKDKMLVYTSLAVAKFPDDERARLQTVSTGYTAPEYIRVLSLSNFTAYHKDLGSIYLSKSLKRCWLDTGYCKQVKFKIIG
jgi:hypothetical protein